MHTTHTTHNHRQHAGAMLLLMIITPLMLVSGCKGTEIGGSWAEQPITIDGNFRDWDNHPTLLLEEQGAVVGQCNDGENLYLLFRTNDPKYAMTIRKTGLTLYLDARGEKNKDFKICYKDGPSMEAMTKMGLGMGEQRQERSRDQQREQSDRPDQKPQESSTPTFTCYIKDHIIEKNIPLDGSEGPAASFDTCMGFFTYEFKIPLQQSQTRFYGINAEPGQAIGLGAVWGDMGEMPERPGGMSGGFPRGGGKDGGVRGGGMGRGGGMDGGRGGGPPSGGERPDLPEEQEVWFKAALNTNIPIVEE